MRLVTAILVLHSFPDCKTNRQAGPKWAAPQTPEVLGPGAGTEPHQHAIFYLRLQVIWDPKVSHLSAWLCYARGPNVWNCPHEAMDIDAGCFNHGEGISLSRLHHSAHSFRHLVNVKSMPVLLRSEHQGCWALKERAQSVWPHCSAR